MRTRFLLSIVLAGCATAQRAPAPAHERAVFEGVGVDEVRAAAVAVVSDIGRFMGPARVAGDGRVVGDYALATDQWTRFEVRFDELDGAVAAEVAIVTRDGIACGTGYTRRLSASGYAPGPRYAGTIYVALANGQHEHVSRAVADDGRFRAPSRDSCVHRDRKWTGMSEREILEAIGDRLRSVG